jgi:hypothetical protein
VVRVSLLEQRIVFFLSCRRRIVEHDHPHRLSVPPKVFVILLDRLADIAQTVGGDDEENFILSRSQF